MQRNLDSIINRHGKKVHPASRLHFWQQVTGSGEARIGRDRLGNSTQQCLVSAVATNCDRVLLTHRRSSAAEWPLRRVGRLGPFWFAQSDCIRCECRLIRNCLSVGTRPLGLARSSAFSEARPWERAISPLTLIERQRTGVCPAEPHLGQAQPKAPQHFR